jgi:hemolysin activation/secretion protein
LRVRELRIASVRVSGLERLSESSVRAQLPALLEDTTPALGRLARELSLFNDNPGRSATIEYSGAGEGRMNAEVSVTERSQSRFALSYNNTGTPQTGRSRLTLSGSHYNLFGASHQGSFSIGISPEEPEKVFQMGLSYAIPLPRLGDLLSFSASHSEVNVGTVADVFNVAGNSSTWNLRYARNLVRTAESRHVLEFGYDERRYRDLIDFFGTNIGASVTAKPLSLGYRMQHYWSGQAVQIGLTWQQNLSGGTRNDDAAYAASRFGADANWSTLQVDAGWQRALPGEWVISARMAGQYASEPLIGAEQFGLGGAGAVRGFGEREGAGDRGIRGSLEVTTPLIAGSHRFVAFKIGRAHV